MRFLVVLIVLLSAFVFCALCIRHHAGAIEQSLGQSAADELSALGLSGSAAVADGRDVTLSGTVANEDVKIRAAETVAAIPGVRVVDNLLEVPALPSSEFELTFERGTAVLRGLVPSADLRDRLLARARELYGAESVSDELRIGESLEQPWLADLDGALGSFHGTEGGLLSTGLRVVGNQLILTGDVPSDGARDSIEEALTGALPDLEVDNQLRVVAPTAQISALLEIENIEFETNSDRLTVRGRAVVERVRAVLANSDDFEIEIAGHTDSQGEALYNLDLSRRRAQTVLLALAQTLPRESFAVRGYGEEWPIADNKTPEGRQRNRRIEFRILEESGR